MSNRRKLRASELARQDQNRAEARGMRARTDAAIMHVTILNPGEKGCCWCDCAEDAHEGTCPAGGCREDAAYEAVLVAGAGQPDVGWPVCERHYEPFATWLMRQVPGLPLAVLERPVLDEDQEAGP
jgi:hypothetical protein